MSSFAYTMRNIRNSNTLRQELRSGQAARLNTEENAPREWGWSEKKKAKPNSEAQKHYIQSAVRSATFVLHDPS